MGMEAKAIGANAMALGAGSTASSGNSLALGAGAYASGGNAVALGAGSYMEVPMGAAYLTGLAAPAASVSVGNANAAFGPTFQRRISNVSDGADGYDAVNVRQLSQLQQNVATMVGSGVTVNPDGSFSYALTAGAPGSETTYTSINQALAVALGDVIPPGSGTSLAVQYSSTNQEAINLSGALDGSQIGTRITNLADPTAPRDATNKQYVDTLVDANSVHYFSVEGANINDANYGNDGAFGNNSIALGRSSIAMGQDSVAFGTGTAAGANSTQSGVVALGSEAVAYGTQAISVGQAAATYFDGAIAMGGQSVSYGEDGIAIGRNALVDQNVVNGSRADYGVAVGSNAYVERQRGVAVGPDAQSRADAAIALGSLSNASGTQAIALGVASAGSGQDAIAVGSSSVGAGKEATAIGMRSEAYAEQGIAIGMSAISGYRNATPEQAAASTGAAALGTYATAQGRESIALGYSTQTYAVQATALGAGATAGVATPDDPESAPGRGAVAVGYGAGARADESTALGNNAQATAARTVVLGSQAQAWAENAVALGSGASASAANSIAIGTGSITESGYGTSTAVYSNIQNNDGASGVVSLGGGGISRRITNVAGGQDPGDAVNVAQLQAVDELLTQRGVSVRTQDNVVTHRDLGQTFDISGGGTTAGTYSSRNTKTVTSGGTVFIQLADTPSFSGADMGNQKITRVAPGILSAASTDAVNGSQLYATNTSLTTLTNTFNQIAGDTSQAYTDLNGMGIRYVRTNENGLSPQDAYATGQGSTALGYQATAAAASALAAGRGSQASGVNSVALGSGAKVTAASSVALGAASIADGTTLGGPAYTPGAGQVAGLTPVGEVSVGSANNERRITNVAAGSKATDAVNVSQLQSVQGEITDVSDRAVKYDGSSGDPKTTITLEGPVSADGGVTGGTRMTNLAQGDLSATSTDAVNGAQLYATNNNVTTLGNTVNHIAGDTSAVYTDANGMGIRYVRTNEQGLAEEDAYAQGQGSTALGYTATASGQNALAAGRGAMATAANSVALGAASIASGASLGSAAYNPGRGQLAGLVPVGEVSIGSAGNERRITNVAAGSQDTDAVNVSQLRSVQGEIVDVTDRAVKYDGASGDPKTSITLEGPASPDGGVTGGTRITNVAQGDLSATSTDAVNGAQLYATNTNLTTLGDTVYHITGDTSLAFTNTNGIGIRYARTNESGLPEEDAYAQGQGSTALGYQATAAGQNALAAGRDASASATDAVALGQGANASMANSVALGAGSIADGATLGNPAYQPGIGVVAGLVPFGEVSVGAAGRERRITNVAAGAEDTDAVNVSQLRNVQNQVDVNTGDIVGLDGRVTNIEGDIGDINTGAAGMFRVSQDNNAPPPTPTGLNSAAGGTGAVASGANALAVGNGSQATADNATAIGTGAQANQAGDVALGAGAVADRGSESYVGLYSGANNVTSGTVSVGNAATGETRTISNVADGRLATDAVNVRQLEGAVQAANNYTDQQINNALQDIDTGSVGMFQVSQDNNAPMPSPTGQDSAAGGAGAVASGNHSTAIGNGSRASAEGATSLGNGAQATAANSVAIGQGSVADQANTVSVGSAGAERRITNVAAGVVSATSTDAVNGSQLHGTNELINTVIEGKAGLVQQQTSDGDVTVAKNSGGTTVNVSGTSGDRRLSGVADGRAPNDAATVNQLAGLSNQVGNLDGRINRVENRANAGVASALAAAGLPQAYLPGKSMLSMAGGSWNGETGLALGLSAVSDNGSWVVKGNATTSSRGDFGGSVGVGYQW